MSCEEWTVLANFLVEMGILICVAFTITFILMRVIGWVTKDE